MFSQIKSLILRLPSWLSWSAWQRVLAITPFVALLWLAVMWANAEATSW